MRRLFVLALLMVLVIVPTAAFAQDATPETTDQAVWNLNQPFTVTDLGFQFNYPEGWVTDSSSGIKLAENQDDLNTLLDTDDSTNPKGYAIFLSGASLTALNMQPDAKLDDVIDSLVKTANFSETESRVDEPIMARRSVTVIGKNASGRESIVTAWLQDGNLVVLSLTGPTVDHNVGYTWGLLLGSVTPVNALALGETPVTSPNGDFTMSYPKDWFTNAASQSSIIAENNDDLAAMMNGGAPKKGISVVILQGKLSDMGAGVTDLTTLGDSLHKAAKWDDTVIPAEFIVAGQPAITYSGPVPDSASAGAVEVYTAFLKDADNAVLIGVFAPTQDDLTTFMPTYLTMLASVTPVKSSS